MDNAMDNTMVNSNNSPVVGYWNIRKDKLKQMFPSISDEDLTFNDGKEMEMIELLSYKVDKSVDELRSIINKL
jgi:hypothetical protein